MRWCQTSLTGTLAPWSEVILCVIRRETLKKVFCTSTGFAFNRGLGQRRPIYNPGSASSRRTMFRLSMWNCSTTFSAAMRKLATKEQVDIVLSAVLRYWQVEHRAVVIQGRPWRLEVLLLSPYLTSLPAMMVILHEPIQQETGTRVSVSR